MLLASAMFAIMGSFVKLGTEHGASLPQVVLFRGLPSVILLLIWARAGRQSIIPVSWKLHLWRNLSGVTSMWLGFFAIAHLPLATATSLNYTAPLFIACWMLGWGGAQRDPVRIVAVALGFLGVIAVLRPSINEDQWLAALLGMTAGAMSAIAMMQIRQLGRVGEPEWRTVLFFSVAVCVSSLAGLLFEGWGHADWTGYLSLLGVGVTGLFGQLAMTRAFGLGSALLTAALQYSTIIFAALLGMGFWGEQLDALAWAGMGLIIFAGLLSIWRTMRDPKPA
ncbi:DMT family transporter [Achromobacter aegrifaciens]|nr:Pseudopaline exporter CntI [Achromobacter aegrifaciens]CAB3885040.1 Pseudopaline exporter CntI [Achromobacter aegrifaciens]CAB3891646.1 Pseudopaline exporter CntI [Achromobacter aegrifaciens]CUI49976.1 Predicted permease%2C DMT superfamily [Achromobacter aegrifaciens]